MCQSMVILFGQCLHYFPHDVMVVACNTLRASWVPISQGDVNCPHRSEDLIVTLHERICDSCYAAARTQGDSQTNGGSADGQGVNGINSGTNGYYGQNDGTNGYYENGA